MSLAILLLAAGSSSRMGQPKQLLPWADTTLIGYAVRQALPVADQVFVVVGAKSEAVTKELNGLPVNIIENTEYSNGLGSSLAKGVQVITAGPRNYTSLMVTLADQPSVDSAYLQELRDMADRYPNRIIATAYGKRPGVPALFPAAYFSELCALGGDAGAGALLRKHAGSVMLHQPTHPIYDIDTPEEYRRHEGDQKHH